MPSAPGVAARRPMFVNTGNAMRIDLLTAPECPNAERARAVVAECLDTLGLDVPVHHLVGQYPSPTVLIDGIDVMRPESGPPTGDACRLDLPTRQRVLDALGGERRQR